ncbi:MAG: hypothetical protein KDB82_13265 [Planctomycetes bacterium]|nr:hypothetical protein [Planctomycetota bacterium]
MKTVWIVAISLLLISSSLVVAEDNDAKFRLYNVKGREWTLKFMDGNEEVGGSIHYEVKSVSNNVCQLKSTTITVSDKGSKKTKRDTQKFTMTEESGGNFLRPPEGAKKLREDVLTVKAGKFDCVVYDVNGETHYMSKAFPGLLVKRIQPGYLDLVLVEFETMDGDPPTTTQAPPKEEPAPATKGEGGGRILPPFTPWPSATPDHRLYKKDGREWEVMERRFKDDKWQDSVKVTHEITGLEGTKATEKVTRRSATDKKADPVVRENDIPFGPPGAKYAGLARRGDFQYAIYADRKIKVEAGVFDCYVIIAYRNRGRVVDRSIYYISKAYPGLQVYVSFAGHQEELMKFERDKDDKGEGKETHEILDAEDFILPEGSAQPAKEEPEDPPAKAELNWSLYENVGRKWMLKRTSMIAGKEQVGYTSYEITDLGLDSCKLKTIALDAKKKAINGDGNTMEIQFNADNAMWCGPIANQEKTGEETIEAAGQKWECIVYKDTKSVKDATTTSWMSKKYPGLWVKMTTKGKYNDSTTELVEFKD